MPGFVSGYTNSISDRRNKYVAQNLGCFLHFNMATFHGTEEEGANTAINDFNPTSLNVGQWLDNVVAMKAVYAVLTVKHWDGFCLWPTATTTRNITQCSPWYGASGIDIAGTFVSECRSRGIAPMFYFSNYDATYVANNSGATQAQARDFQNAQLKELLTNYGPMPAIWTDSTEWEYGNAYPWWDANDYLNTVHAYQPKCLLVNNSHTGDLSDSDIVEFENGTGNGAPSGPCANPSECCETAQQVSGTDKWFWKSAGTLKSSSTLLSNLSTFNGYGCSYLINCPPDDTGVIPSATVTLMGQIGAR